jgi:SAM-dependent methyltransferase
MERDKEQRPETGKSVSDREARLERALYRIREMVASDYCAGESDYAHGVAAASSRHHKGIEKILSDCNLTGYTQNEEEMLKKHFTGVYVSNIESLKYSGCNLVEEVNALQPRRVLDIGCGDNPFRDKIPNLYGIDKFNPNADRVVDFLEFDCEDEFYDVVLALGSINFGSFHVIHASVEKVLRILAPSGLAIFRVNPGLSHPTDPEMEYFPWDEVWISDFAKLFNVEVIGPIQTEDNGRLVFRYKKPPREHICRPTSTSSQTTMDQKRNIEYGKSQA